MKKSIVAVGIIMATATASSFAASCDKKCMEGIGDQYRAAYLKHNPKLAPFAGKVRFSENNVEMQFPDGTWDTVTEEVGTPLTLGAALTLDGDKEQFKGEFSTAANQLIKREYRAPFVVPELA